MTKTEAKAMAYRITEMMFEQAIALDIHRKFIFDLDKGDTEKVEGALDEIAFELHEKGNR